MEFPDRKTKKRVEIRKKRKTLKNYVWRVPTLPKYNCKKGPLDFIYKL